MSLTAEDLWLAEFTGGDALEDDARSQLDRTTTYKITAEKEAREHEKLRRAHLDIMRRRLDEISATVEKFREIRIEMNGLLHKRMRLVGGADPSKSLSAITDYGDIKRVESDDYVAMMRAQEAVVGLKDGLARIQVDRTVPTYQGDVVASTRVVKVRLFEDEEIERELFTPLVRAQLMPEDFVPDVYSQVQRMIDESNELYLERLQAVHGDGTSAFERLAPVLKTLTSSVARVAIEGLKFDEVSDTGQTIGVACIKMAEAIINTGIELRVQYEHGDGFGAANASLDGFSNALEWGLATFLPFAGVDATQAYQIGRYVGISMRGSSRLAAMAKVVADRKDKSFDVVTGELMDVMGDLWVDVGDAIAVSQSNSGAAKTGQAAVWEKTAYKAAAAALKGQLVAKVQTGIETGDWSGVRAISYEITVIAVQGALSHVQQDQIRDEKNKIVPDEDVWNGMSQEKREKLLETELSDRLRKIGMVDVKAGKTASDVEKGLQKLFGAIAKLDASLASAAVDKLLRDPSKEPLLQIDAKEDLAQRRMEEEKAEFAEELELLGRPDLGDAEQKRISQLIAKMKRDQAILQTLFALGSAGGAVAKQFMGPLAAAGTLSSFLQEATLAVQRAIHLHKWLDTQTAAEHAMSPYYASVQSFCKNMKVQLTRHTIRAVLNVLKAGGEIALATPGAAIGAIVKESAAAALAAEDLIFAAYKEATLAKAWKETKKALANPRDRKTNQLARRINPTFAKYTIAYGAYVAKDPVALEAVRKIGLTRETLASKDAGVKKVVEFLETLYNEDIKVYRQMVPDESWVRATPPPALTVGAWMTTIHLAKEKGGLSRDVKVNHIHLAMERVEGLETEVAAAWKEARKLEKSKEGTDIKKMASIDDFETVLKVFDRYAVAVRTLKDLLDVFQPVGTDGKPLLDMIEITKDYSALCTGELANITSDSAMVEDIGGDCQDSVVAVLEDQTKGKSAQEAGITIGAVTTSNPALWVDLNSLDAAARYTVSTARPVGNWLRVNQFCSVLSIEWLNRNGGAGIGFADLGDSEAAVRTLLQYSSLDDQVRYAVQQLSGARKSLKELTDALDGYNAGTKIWFGDNHHVMAAIVKAGKKADVYDSNTGNKTEMAFDKLLEVSQLKNATGIVVKEA